ncbi:hypothetical protein MY8738_005379 [Beauveria namnaoensis]
MDDLLLLHHWSVSASKDIVRSSEIDYYWQTVFPRVGFQYPFVMHGILSLAALHIAHIDSASRKRRTIDASRHHNTSLQGFQQAIGEMSDENSDALFACSILNIIYILAMLRPVNGDSSGGIGSRSRNIRALGTEWIPIIRGVEAVIHPVFDRVRKGPLSPMTNLGNWAELDLASETAPEDEAFCRIRAAWHGMPDSQVYDEALLVLRKCHLYITQFEAMPEESLHAWGYNRGWSGPLMFLHFASEDYFTRLHQRQPPALIIFSYFGALLHGLNDYWFMEGWGKDVVRVTDEVLGEYWESWLEWPKRKVGLGHGT